MAKVKIGNVYPSDEYLLDRCAPTGYGLGDSAQLLTSANDLNTIWQSGWYRWGDSAPNNAPVIKRVNKYGYMRVDGSDEGTFTQTVYSVFGDARGLSVTRCTTEGVVSEWEWVNPPMEIGVEYRTTERWNNKPVYTSLVNVGTYPESGMRNANTGIIATGIIRFHASIGYSSLPLADNMEINTFHEGEEIVVQLNTKGERIYSNDVYVTLYYIKD